MFTKDISTLPRRYQYLYYFYLLQRFQLDVFYLDSKQPARKEDLLKGLNPLGLKWGYRGMGAAFSFLYNWKGNNFQEAVSIFSGNFSRVSAERQEDFYWGMGWGLATVLSEDGARAMDCVNKLPLEGTDAALAGLKVYHQYYGVGPSQ